MYSLCGDGWRVGGVGGDARVLEEASHDLADLDALRAALDARQHAADAAHDEDDLDAGLAGLGEPVDDVAVGERVHLHEDLRGLAGLGAVDLAVDAAHHERLQAHRRHAQVLVLAAEVAEREVTEEGVAVLGDAGVRREQHEVAVEAGRLLVEVTGAEAGDAADAAAVVVGDLADLGVALEALRAVDHGATGVLEAVGPLDVVLLVEAGAQLHEDRDLLAVLDGGHEALAQAAVARHAVERDLDGDTVVIVGGLVQQAKQRAHALVRVAEQDVVVLDLRAHRLAGLHHRRLLRLEGREGERGLAGRGDLALDGEDVGEVGRRGEAEHPALLEGELLAHEGHEVLAELALELHADGLQARAALEHLLHVLAIVLLLLDALAVWVDVGVARHAHDGRARGDVGAEEAVDHRGDDVLDQREAHAVLAGGQPHDALRGGRHLHDAEDALLALAVKRAHDVEDVVAQVGEGVARVDDHRREDGREGRLEAALDGHAVGVGVVGRHDALDALVGELALEVREALLAALVHVG